jgi:hypothetical protein
MSRPYRAVQKICFTIRAAPGGIASIWHRGHCPPRS